MAKKDEAAEWAAEAAEREEGEIIQEMQKETDIEILDYVFDRETPDENDGDHSLEDIDNPLGETEDSEEESDDAEPESQEVESESEETTEGGEEQQRQSYIPPDRLRQEAESRRQVQRENEELRARIERIEASQRQAPQQPPAAPPAPPDMFADPEGFQRHMMQEFERKEHETYVRRSMGQAEDEHGEDFRFARDEILKRRGNPEVEAAADRIFHSANPGRALMQWAEPLLSEFREQQAERVRQQFADMNGISVEDVERMQAMYARQSGRPVQQRRPANNPPSLNGASGGGNRVRERLDPRGMDGSERAIFEDVFRTN